MRLETSAAERTAQHRNVPSSSFMWTSPSVTNFSAHVSGAPPITFGKRARRPPHPPRAVAKWLAENAWSGAIIASTRARIVSAWIALLWLCCLYAKQNGLTSRRKLTVRASYCGVCPGLTALGEHATRRHQVWTCGINIYRNGFPLTYVVLLVEHSVVSTDGIPLYNLRMNTHYMRSAPPSLDM